jgi:hypothetical protein
MSANMGSVFLHETRIVNMYIYVTDTNSRTKFVKLVLISNFELSNFNNFRVCTHFRNNDFLDIEVETSEVRTWLTCARARTHTHTQMHTQWRTISTKRGDEF